MLSGNNLYKNKYRIESTRLKGWDYGWDGFYFITICVKGRIFEFGEVIDEQMVLSEKGEIAKKVMVGLPGHYKNCVLDSFVIMPNHVHCIIQINNDLIINNTVNDELVNQNEIVRANIPDETVKNRRDRFKTCLYGGGRRI